MNKHYEFNTVSLICLLIAAVIVGIASAAIWYNDRLAQADRAVDWIDEQRIRAEVDKLQTLGFIGTLPSNSRHWNTVQRTEYQQFAMLVKQWISNHQDEVAGVR